MTASEAVTGTRTIVFTDLVGSTAMRSRLGDPAADELRRRHDRVLRDAVSAHGGIVAKGLGDGIMAVFESAAGAVEAAVAMQQQIALLGEELGAELAIRVGLSAGDVVAEDGDWFGTPVVEAARLEAAAKGGQILVSDLVRLLAGSRVSATFEPIAALELKGLSGPTAACELQWERLPWVVPDDAVGASVPAHAAARVPGPRGTLLGRDSDVAEVVERLTRSDVRLLTLTGPGGVGKTRLAMAVAESAASQYPDGVRTVELASVSSDQVVSAVATVLEIGEAPATDLAASVAAELGAQTVLLVLDNCEHVVAAAAMLVRQLLSAAPTVDVLATSQVALTVVGETLFEVGALDVPGHGAPPEEAAGSTAVRLFVDRATQVDRTFELSDENTEAVARICRQLDGLPLAIELAAARMRVLSPEEIAERLDDRFRLLTRGDRSADERHHTLRAAVDWSFSLLVDEERRAMSHLALLPGGFDLGMAEVMIGDAHGDVLEVVASLVDKSLLVTTRPDAQTRFRMLETVRAFAIELLDESGGVEAADRVLRWAMGLADAVEASLDGPEEDAWLARVAAEVDNLQASLQLALQRGDLVPAVSLVCVLADWCYQAGQYAEGISLCDEVMDAGHLEGVVRRRLLMRLGNVALGGCRFERAEHAYEEARALALRLGDVRGAWGPQQNLAAVAMWQGQFWKMQALLDEAPPATAPEGYEIYARLTGAYLALYRAQLDEATVLLDVTSSAYESVGETTIAEVELVRGMVRYAAGDLTAAAAQYEVALDRASQVRVGAEELLGLARNGLGLVALRRGDTAAARALLEAALADSCASRMTAMALQGLGAVDQAERRHDPALERLEEALRLHLSIGDQYGVAVDLEGHASIALGVGQHLSAARMYGAAAGLRELSGTPPWPVDEPRLDAELDVLREQLDPQFSSVWSEGRSLADRPEMPLADRVAALEMGP